MTIFDGLRGALGKAGKSARKTFDSKKLDYRLRYYEKEENECLREIGRLYCQKVSDGGASFDFQLAELVRNAEDIRRRKRQLGRLRDEIARKDQRLVNEAEVCPQKLNKNDNDIRIKRTENGISLFRICPVCKTENLSSALSCHECGAGLKNCAQ